MNSRQERKIRHARSKIKTHVCPECGQKGHFHLITMEGMIFGQPGQSYFWTCPKFYGEDGRRTNLQPNHIPVGEGFEERSLWD